VNLSEQVFADPLTVEFGRDNRQRAGFYMARTGVSAAILRLLN
jgi:hypothetical protein